MLAPETHDQPALRTMRAIGTTAIVTVTEPGAIDRAEAVLRDELVAIDVTCSRFRPDSELSDLHRGNGERRKVSALLFEAIRVACDVARRTEGAVDPTVGNAVEALGYDRDFAKLDPWGVALEHAPRPTPGWWQIELDERQRTVRVPAGIHIDLGASAKALVADRAARRIAPRAHTGVLVSVGGDVATAGAPPEGGWAVGIAADSNTPLDDVDQVVTIESGGLASSATAVRTWHRGGRRLHHIVDPATGDSVTPHWTLASATGATCVEANAASTAAVVWGRRAPTKLEALGQPARLVRHDGQVFTVLGWPTEHRSPS
ncbi:MAG TPA: FAD:protein FMN transferase [Acidimicrobiales bacterium]|nr:FAD:protein FMN transferase [Acidimicrobiales bacterium]